MSTLLYFWVVFTTTRSPQSKLSGPRFSRARVNSKQTTTREGFEYNYGLLCGVSSVATEMFDSKFCRENLVEAVVEHLLLRKLRKKIQKKTQKINGRFSLAPRRGERHLLKCSFSQDFKNC